MPRPPPRRATTLPPEVFTSKFSSLKYLGVPPTTWKVPLAFHRLKRSFTNSHSRSRPKRDFPIDEDTLRTNAEEGEAGSIPDVTELSNEQIRNLYTRLDKLENELLSVKKDLEGHEMRLLDESLKFLSVRSDSYSSSNASWDAAVQDQTEEESAGAELSVQTVVSEVTAFKVSNAAIDSQVRSVNNAAQSLGPRVSDARLESSKQDPFKGECLSTDSALGSDDSNKENVPPREWGQKQSKVRPFMSHAKLKQELSESAKKYSPGEAMKISSTLTTSVGTSIPYNPHKLLRSNIRVLEWLEYTDCTNSLESPQQAMPQDTTRNFSEIKSVLHNGNRISNEETSTTEGKEASDICPSGSRSVKPTPLQRPKRAPSTGAYDAFWSRHGIYGHKPPMTNYAAGKRNYAPQLRREHRKIGTKSELIEGRRGRDRAAR